MPGVQRRNQGTGAQNQNPMTTDGVVPWNYSIHVFAPRAGCGEAYPTSNTGRRDAPLPCLALGGEINRPDSVELHGGNVPSQETRRFVVAGTDSSKTSNFD